MKQSLSFFKCYSRSVDEVHLRMQNKNLEASDLLLKIVDTPGFFDSAGKPQNQENFKLLDEYRSVVLGGCFPNIVLIAVSAKNDRFRGSDANFVKSLGLLKKLNVIDPVNNNAVCVITSAMLIDVRCRERWAEQWTLNIRERQKAIAEVLEENLGVQIPVVYTDNNTFDPRIATLPGEPWTVLPDGTRQPLNVFECVRDILRVRAFDVDPLGLSALASFFSGKWALEKVNTLEGTTVALQSTVTKEVLEQFG